MKKVRALKLSVVFMSMAAASWAQVTFSTGVNGQISVPGILPASVEPLVKAEGDFLLPLSDQATLLLNADGRLGYAAPESLLGWRGEAEADFTWRGDSWFWKVGVRGHGEGEALSGSAELSAAILASAAVDIGALTLSFSPEVRWSTDPEAQPGVSGKLAATLPIGDEIVQRTTLESGAEGPGLAGWFLAASAGLTWYSPALVVLSLDGGYTRRISPFSETVEVDGTAVSIPSADDYHEAFLRPEVSFAPGPGILVTAAVPAGLRLWTHGVVGDGTLVPAGEWALTLSPAGFIRFDLSESFGLKVSAGADLTLTNSAYREGSSVYLSVEGMLTLGDR